LIDVYGTLLDVDLDRIWHGLAAPTGLHPDRLRQATDRHIPAVMIGRMSLPDAFAAGLNAHEIDATTDLLAEMIRLDSLLLAAHSDVHDDAVRFMRERRSAGDRIAIVSNSAANTRGLLDGLGLSETAHAVVLSCEIGSAKPDRRIFEHTLALLDVTAENATLIDDQLAYCRGATEAGLDAIHLSRAGSPEARVAGPTRVRSFDAIEP
jgi:putative hydrolase of the HAD superfamily